MTKTKTINDVRLALTAALNEAQQAKPYDGATNPLAHLELVDLVHGKGILKAADHMPAVNMNAKLDGKSQIAATTEAARKAGLAAGREDRSNRRMAAARARAARKAQIDAIADSPVVPSPQRLTTAWEVVLPLQPIVEKVARSKRAWAARFLGSLADDIGMVALERMVLVLAKDDRHDLAVLAEAARELGGITARTGQLPGDQVVDDAERKHRRAVGKGRKWLMGMVNNRVMGALCDAYTEQRNLRWENIDLIATVMASINGVGDDPLVAATKASLPPTMMGTRMRRPDEYDKTWLAEVVSAAITHRGLDRMVELLLDDSRRRTDGSFRWADNAEAIFLATPDPWGGRSQVAPLQWTLVKSATAKLANPRAGQADAAREHVRKTFAFLPNVIVAAIKAFDHEATTRTLFIDDSIHASISSEFERRIGTAHAGLGRKRQVARPALSFASAHEAAVALAQVVAQTAVTGKEVAASIAYA